MTLARKIAYNTIISTGARIIAVSLSLVSIGFIARYLGQEGFGNYSLVLAILFTFDILADFGLYSLMVREISKPKADEKKIASNIFTIRIIAILFFLGLAILFVFILPYTSQIRLGVVIGSIGFIFLSSSQVLMGVFQKYLRTDKPGLADVIGRIVQVGLVILFISLDLGFFAIIIALCLGCITNFFFNWFFAQKHIKLSLSFDFKLWKKIINAAIPIAASIVLTLVYFKLDTIFLSLKAINSSSLNPSIDVGIYNISYKILEGLIFFPAMFTGLIMPLLSKFAFTNKGEFIKIFQKTLDFLIVLIIPLMIGLLLLSTPIVLLIGGKDFIASAIVLQILSIAIGLIFLGNLFGRAIIALDKQKKAAWIYFSGMFFNVITNLIFIPRFSYLGAAITTVFTELLVTILMIVLIYKTINYFPSFKIIFKALFAGIIMGLFIFFFQSWNVFLLIVLGFLIYMIILYLIKGISKKEIQVLFKKTS
ncbi:flippase [Patescibacteria group bacterium]|nr:flippase [Patescibacteria group bacterium]